jgi:hypothetical protein
MVSKGKERVLIATGPYNINEGNIEAMLPKVRFRHFKSDEIAEARDWLRQYKHAGQYYFDWYLQTSASEHIIYEMQPLDIADACPWMLRIDCVVQRRGTDLIVEFTDRLRSTSIGQVHVYQHLYEREVGVIGKTIPVLVVYEDEPKLHNVCDSLGIIVEKVV